MIDELNIIGSSTEKEKYIPIERYFKEMEISDEQIEERENVADEWLNLMLLLFSLVEMMNDGKIGYETVLNTFRSKARNIVEKVADYDEYYQQYVNDVTYDILTTTMSKTALNSEGKTEDDNFYTSYERAVLSAENEANTICNYKDYVNAIKHGKTHKVWLTKEDERVRLTHREVDKIKLPILKLYLVGNSQMRFPHDTAYGASPREYINCRCSIKYLPEDNYKNGKSYK